MEHVDAGVAAGIGMTGGLVATSMAPPPGAPWWAGYVLTLLLTLVPLAIKAVAVVRGNDKPGQGSGKPE